MICIQMVHLGFIIAILKCMNTYVRVSTISFFESALNLMLMPNK